VAGWGNEREYVCVQCRGLIADGLARLGSVLCHDCREEQRVDAVLVRSMPKQRSTTWPRGWGGDGDVRPNSAGSKDDFEAGEESVESEPPEPPRLDPP
jgi:hypothetical protein